VEMLWKDWRWYDAQVTGWSLQKGHKLPYVCDESIEWVKCFFDRDTGSRDGYVSWRLGGDHPGGWETRCARWSDNTSMEVR
jgi:hypothetical protein